MSVIDISQQDITKKSSQHRGFTLIELLVVIAIIGILASIILASLGAARSKGLDTQRIGDMKGIQTALELYYTTYQHYPISASWSSQCAGYGSVAQNSVIPGLVPTYISTMPVDPGMVVSTNVDCFVYKSDATGVDYKLLDYNMDSSVNPSEEPNFIDPERNAGKSWAVSGCSGVVNSASTWAIWSSPTSQCW